MRRIEEKENKENRTDPKDVKIFELQSEVDSLRQENKRLRQENKRLRRESEVLREGNRRILTREKKGEANLEKLRISISVEKRRVLLLEEEINAEKKRKIKHMNQRSKEISRLIKCSHSIVRSTLSMLR